MRRSLTLSAFCTLLGCGALLDLPDAQLDSSIDGGLGSSSGLSGSSGIGGSSGLGGSSGGSSGLGGSSGVEPADGSTCTEGSASDPRSCGRCGQDCGAGTCESGICQGAQLVTTQSGPNSLVIWNHTLYWANYGYGANSGELRRLDLSDANAVSIQMVAAASPNNVAVDATGVYFADDQGVSQCGLVECSAAPHLDGLKRGDVSALAIDDTSLYVATTAPADGLLRTSKQGGGATSISSLDNIQKIVVRGTSLFVANASGSSILLATGPNEPTPDAFAPSADRPGGLAVLADGTRAFFGIVHGDGVADQVESIVPGNPSTHLYYGVGASTYPYEIATDGTFVYWTNLGSDQSATGSVMACPVSGCSEPMVLARDVPVARGLAVDDTHVYYASVGLNDDDGYIGRVVKPVLP